MDKKILKDSLMSLFGVGGNFIKVYTFSPKHEVDEDENIPMSELEEITESTIDNIVKYVTEIYPLSKMGG